MEQIAYTTPRPTVPAVAEKDYDAGKYASTVLLLVMSQMVQDLVTEFRNLPEMRGKFRWEFTTVAGTLGQLNNRVRRCLPSDVARRFDQMLCDIADDVEDSVKRVRVSLRSVLVQKISYNQIESAILTGIIGGIIDTMQQVNQSISGRKRYEFQVCYNQIRHIEEAIGFRRLNDDSDPDFSECKAVMIDMFRTLGDIIDKKIKITQI